MKIRRATLSDASTIAGFNARLAWETEHRRLDSARVRRGVATLLKDPAKGTYFVAEEKGAIIGQLLITPEWSDWRNGNFWWIQSVYVAPEFRRRGVFCALFTHVQKLANSRRDVCGLRLYVETANHRAQRTYQRLAMRAAPYKIFEMDFVLRKPKTFPS
jgi:ribosomal protein S18 acetylase RimI-like enzyme